MLLNLLRRRNFINNSSITIRSLSYSFKNCHQSQPKIMGDSTVVITGVPLNTVIEKLTDFAPLSLAQSWDNVGLLVEPFKPKIISHVLLTNDLTEDVIQEAVDINADLIISYHPPIFSPLKSVTMRTWKERIIAQCLEKGIAVFSPHTTWDSTSNGMADWLISCLPLKSSTPIIPGPQPETGVGRTGSLVEPVTIKHAIECIKTHTGLSFLKLALAKGKTIESLVGSAAVCPGSGTSVLKGVPADLYITGEMLHHDLLEATHCGTTVVLCNHSDSERGFLKELASRSVLKSLNISISISQKDHDPIITV